MKAKTILITGSTAGIGLAGAEALGRLGWRVLVHGRTEARGRPVVDDLQARISSGSFELVTGDLSAMGEVEGLAAQVRALAPDLDGLWSNAGLMTPAPVTTADGFELQWAVNHLAPFALVQALLPLLRRAPQGRIVQTSSLAHYLGRVPPEGGFDVPGDRYRGLQTYADTKLANVLMVAGLARRLEGTKVTAHAFHPGYVKTSIGANGDPARGNSGSWLSFLQIPPEQGAETGVFLTSAEEPARTSGRYWSGLRVRRGSGRVTEEAVEALWTRTEAALASVRPRA